jgi:hypothetical protein
MMNFTVFSLTPRKCMRFIAYRSAQTTLKNDDWTAYIEEPFAVWSAELKQQCQTLAYCSEILRAWLKNQRAKQSKEGAGRVSTKLFIYYEPSPVGDHILTDRRATALDEWKYQRYNLSKTERDDDGGWRVIPSVVTAASHHDKDWKSTAYTSNHMYVYSYATSEAIIRIRHYSLLPLSYTYICVRFCVLGYTFFFRRDDGASFVCGTTESIKSESDLINYEMEKTVHTMWIHIMYVPQPQSMNDNNRRSIKVSSFFSCFAWFLLNSAHCLYAIEWRKQCPLLWAWCRWMWLLFGSMDICKWLDRDRESCWMGRQIDKRLTQSGEWEENWNMQLWHRKIDIFLQLKLWNQTGRWIGKFKTIETQATVERTKLHSKDGTSESITNVLKGLTWFFGWFFK